MGCGLGLGFCLLESSKYTILNFSNHLYCNELRLYDKYIFLKYSSNLALHLKIKIEITVGFPI